ncbi:MAG: hypothetical protein JSR82_13225 [Verrucomicrobia bacterium]|nr:hypothetical protein [Verrucomicrobiota bacterium]
MRFAVTLIEYPDRCEAWCDDLPGCHAEAPTRAEALERMRGAIRQTLAAQPGVRTTAGARISREVLVFE